MWHKTELKNDLLAQSGAHLGAQFMSIIPEIILMILGETSCHNWNMDHIGNYHGWGTGRTSDTVRVVRPNSLFCIYQRYSEGVCRGKR